MPIHLPKKSDTPIGSKYAPLGLTDMPFPSDGFVDPYSTDPRTNGSIYAVDTAKSAIAKFESLLIRPDDFPNRVRLAYLWSKGDSESGRGVGKTALLRYFRHRINSDWGSTEFGDKFSAVVVYVGFRNQVDRRHMEQLALSARGIIVAHLDYFRADQKDKGTIKPFSQDGIDALLGAQTVHPRATLSTAAKAVQYAIDKGLTSLNAECVKAAAESHPSPTAPDFSEGIEGAV